MKEHIQKICAGIILFLSVFNIPANGIAADVITEDIFYVIHVQGDIFHKTSGERLKTEDKLTNENEILFKSPDAWAVVISPKKGRMYLCPDHLKISKIRNEFTDFVRSCLLPSRKNVSTRLIPDRKEAAFLISVLKKTGKNEAEIKTEVLDFLMDVYYGESGEIPAKNWLEKEFQRQEDGTIKEKTTDYK